MASVRLNIFHSTNFLKYCAGQVPEIYKEMENAGCTPDGKAREMLKITLAVLEQRNCKYCITTCLSFGREYG